MAGVRDIIHSFVFMVNQCEIITLCLEVCYENNLPFDKVYDLIGQVKEDIDEIIDDCQKYLKHKEHDDVSAILNRCISYKHEFEKSPSQTRVAKRIYKDNKPRKNKYNNQTIQSNENNKQQHQTGRALY